MGVSSLGGSLPVQVAVFVFSPAGTKYSRWKTLKREELCFAGCSGAGIRVALVRTQVWAAVRSHLDTGPQRQAQGPGPGFDNYLVLSFFLSFGLLRQGLSLLFELVLNSLDSPGWP